jgi:hypothetical protein
MSELEFARERGVGRSISSRDRYRQRVPRYSSPKTMERTRSDRPMPAEGEVPAIRLLKNMLAAAISGAGHEAGEYYKRARIKQRAEDPSLLLLMILAGGEQIGTECGEFFDKFDFPATLPPHEEE